ncbi:hypothetical protein K501DRAFT_268015 [Backusella circina FSU 941]|nr:hypothetical protein K501DRAFT_268015 [Backusella circina FSU 941]
MICLGNSLGLGIKLRDTARVEGELILNISDIQIWKAFIHRTFSCISLSFEYFLYIYIIIKEINIVYGYWRLYAVLKRRISTNISEKMLLAAYYMYGIKHWFSRGVSLQTRKQEKNTNVDS